MNETTLIRLDAPRLARGGLRCPVCGRVHGVGVRVFGAALVLAVVLSLAGGGRAEAGASAGAYQAEVGQADVATVDSRGTGGVVEAGIGATDHADAQTITELHTAAAGGRLARPGLKSDPPQAAEIAAAATEQLAPATPAVPDTVVVWNRTGLGVYLWDRPGGVIAGFVENGLVVRVTERWDSYGGVPFGEVEFEGATGWVDMRSVHRVLLPAGGFERLADGAYLYDAPGGEALAWLPPGTPVVVVAEQGVAGWEEVEVLVGSEHGWIAIDAR